MANEKFTATQIIEALRATKGMVYVAADRLGCSYQTVYNYGQRYASVKAEMEKQDGIIDDTAELKLIQAIYAGEPWAIKFRLATKAKHRGYVERQEVSGPEGGAIKQKIIIEYADMEIDGNDKDSSA